MKIFSKKITILLATLMFIFILAPLMTKAASEENSDTMLSKIIGFILITVLQPIWAFAIMIAVWLLEVAMNVNLKIISSPMVQIGWQILLQFANLGFVLVIIVMAFATIFQQQTYAMKETLWKLIVAALLVNFSLVIAGGFISVSDLLSTILLNKIAGIDTNQHGIIAGGTMVANVGNALMNFFKGQVLGQVVTGFGGGAINTLNGISSALMLVVLGGTFINFFSFLIFLTLLAMAIMFLIRYVFLGIILLLSPLAWLAWILPNTNRYWKKWWEEFLRWVFFPPVVFFFLWLSIATLNGVGQVAGLRGTFQGDADTKITDVANNKLTFGIDVIGEMTIAIVLTLAGLYMANKMSIMGGEEAFGAASSATKYVAGTGGAKFLGMGPGGKWLRQKIGTDWAKKEEGSLRRRISNLSNKLVNKIPQPIKKAYTDTEKKYGLKEFNSGFLGTLLIGAKSKGKDWRLLYGGEKVGGELKVALKGVGIWKKESKGDKVKRLRGQDKELSREDAQLYAALNKPDLNVEERKKIEERRKEISEEQEKNKLDISQTIEESLEGGEKKEEKKE